MRYRRLSQISLKEAVKFHGHLGPYLVLGLRAGELALKKLGCKRYFGLKVKVWGATEKPKSCLIDGLQLSTGATYGKGNIEKNHAERIRMLFSCTKAHKKITMVPTRHVTEKLETLSSHYDSKMYAKLLYRSNPRGLFEITK